MKKIPSMLAALAVILSIAGCSKGETSEPVATTTTAPIYVQEDEMIYADDVIDETVSAEDEDVNPSDTSESEDAEEILLVPAIDNNIADSVPIESITIGDTTVVVGGMLSDILNTTGLSLCSYGTTSLKNDGYTFLSAMYGVQKDVNDPLSYSGTMVSIEVTDGQGNLVSPAEVDTKMSETYNVKGVHIDEFFTKDDFELQFYGGIKVGMKEDEVIGLLGEGTEIRARTYYRNTTHTLAIEYEGSTDGRIIDSITLLVN